MIEQWQRVRIATWTPNKDVRVKRVLLDRPRRKRKWADPGHQVLEDLIGITVPVEHPEGIVVFAREYRSGGTVRQWVKCDPRLGYYVVDPKWLDVLGPAHDEEVRHAQAGIRVFELELRENGKQKAKINPNLARRIKRLSQRDRKA